jgi:WD40 repeat protein
VVSPDGKLLAVATGGQVALWDLDAQRPLAVLTNGLTAPLAFTADGSLLALGSHGGGGPPGVVLWDVKAGRAVKAMTNNAGVRSLAISPDGRLLATFDNRGSIQVVEWSSDRMLTNFAVSLPRYSTAGVVAFSPDGTRLAIGEDYGRVRLLDLPSRSLLRLPGELGVAVMALAFSPTGDRLAAGYGYGNGAIRLWDPATREIRGELTNHADDVIALAFTPDGKQLASASHDWSLRIWDVTNCEQLRCFWSSGEGLTAFAMLPESKRVVTGGYGGSVCFWNLGTNRWPASFTNFAVSCGVKAAAELDATSFTAEPPDPRTVCRCGTAFTPDSRHFITLEPGGSVVMWDARSLRPLKDLPAFGSNHWGVALSPDGHWLATGDSEGRITIWDWATRRSVNRFTVPFEWFGLLYFSPSGRYLTASVYRNDHSFRARVWRTDDWAEVPLTQAQSAGLWLVAFAPDDQRFAGGYRNGTIKLFRFPSGHPESGRQEARFSNHHSLVSGLRFSPDGRALCSASWDGYIRFWDAVACREQKPELRGHLATIWGSALSPDGRRLATVGTVPGDAVKLWDLAARREVLSLQGVGAIFCDPVFSPDGNTLAAVAMTGIANLWRAPSWEEIEAAEKAPVAERDQ